VYVRPGNFPDVEKFIIPSCNDSILWTFSFSLLFHGEKTSRESREWRWDIVILPLVHLPAFDRDFWDWDRRHNILDGFDKFGGLFVQGMEVCNQLGIVGRERFRGHGRWWCRAEFRSPDVVVRSSGIHSVIATQQSLRLDNGESSGQGPSRWSQPIA